MNAAKASTEMRKKPKEGGEIILKQQKFHIPEAQSYQSYCPFVGLLQVGIENPVIANDTSDSIRERNPIWIEMKTRP